MANKSKTYLLPYIDDYIPIKYTGSLLDTYLFYQQDYKICLLFRFNGSKKFLDYETELMSNEYFDRIIDIHPDKVLYVFHTPEDLFSIINLFLEGKYSYLPEKDKIKDFLIDNFNLPENHRIFHILDRSEQLREQLEDRLKVKIPEDLDLAEPPEIEMEEFKEVNLNEEKEKYRIFRR